MTDVLTKRTDHKLVFNEGDERWSFPNPLNPRLEECDRLARGYDGTGDTVPRQDALVLASFAAACQWLLVDCPTTERAIEQLRAIRRAVAELKKTP